MQILILLSFKILDARRIILTESYILFGWIKSLKAKAKAKSLKAKAKAKARKFGLEAKAKAKA